MPDTTSGMPPQSITNIVPGIHDPSNLPICQYWWTGRISYEDARQLQESLAGQIYRGESPPTLLLLEHPHTFTLGRRGQEKNLLWDAATCEARGVCVYWIDRGGDITYHGPGQLVGYPLLPLGTPSATANPAHLPQADYLGYLRRLEEMLIQALACLGVAGLQVAGKTGVWVQYGQQMMKLASIGVKVDAHGITRHGFALNVAPDMAYWQGIIACGLDGEQMISLAALLPTPPSMQQVCRAVVHAFRERFHYHMVKYP